MDSKDLDRSRLPHHVAIIMDGNGRWATLQGKSRIEGHRRGKTSVRVIVETTRKAGYPFFNSLRILDGKLAAPSGRSLCTDGLAGNLPYC